VISVRKGKPMSNDRCRFPVLAGLASFLILASACVQSDRPHGAADAAQASGDVGMADMPIPAGNDAGPGAAQDAAVTATGTGSGTGTGTGSGAATGLGTGTTTRTSTGTAGTDAGMADVPISAGNDAGPGAAQDAAPTATRTGSGTGTGTGTTTRTGTGTAGTTTRTSTGTAGSDAGMTDVPIPAGNDAGPAARDATTLLAPNRVTVWNPGLTAVGDIPTDRTTIYMTLSPSGGDDTAAIQDALNTCPANQVVQLTAGTFNITGGGLDIYQHSNITLRGMGPNLTKLVKAQGTSYPVIAVGWRGYYYEDQVPLAADGLKESASVTLFGAFSSGIPLSVGELVVIDHVTNSLSWWNPDPSRSPGGGPTVDPSRGWFCEYDRPIGQVLEVQSVSGNTVTFTTGLHTDFMVADKSQLTRYTVDSDHHHLLTPVQWVGIEDLYVAYGEGGDSGGNIHMYATKYCWVKNVESDKSLGTSVNLEGSFRCTVRDSYVHSTVQPDPGGGGYGIGVNNYGADNLIENNISWNFNKVMVMRASGGGNVIGYNYMQDGYGAAYPNQVEVGLNAAHFTTPHYELFEGNESYAFSSDSTWGNSIYITAFRNSLTTQRVAAGPLKTYSYTDPGNNQTYYFEDEYSRDAIGICPFHHYYNFVGNVLGYSGMALLTNPKSFYKVPQTAFVLVDDQVGGHVPMWSLGIGQDNYITADPQVLATAFQHGNYDYVTNAVQWDPSNANHTLPASLYLTAKPAFFGSNPWPWVTPENAPNTTAVLPAKVRFNNIQAGTGL
jgi:hypothetical protein